MGDGADPADPRRNPVHLVESPADEYALEETLAFVDLKRYAAPF